MVGWLHRVVWGVGCKRADGVGGGIPGTQTPIPPPMATHTPGLARLAGGKDDGVPHDVHGNGAEEVLRGRGLHLCPHVDLGRGWEREEEVGSGGEKSTAFTLTGHGGGPGRKPPARLGVQDGEPPRPLDTTYQYLGGTARRLLEAGGGTCDTEWHPCKAASHRVLNVLCADRGVGALLKPLATPPPSHLHAPHLEHPRPCQGMIAIGGAQELLVQLLCTCSVAVGRPG